MKLLLDNNLSPQLVALLAVQGHEAEHVRDRGMHAATRSVAFVQVNATSAPQRQTSSLRLTTVH